MSATVWVLGSSNIDTTYRVNEFAREGFTVQAKACARASGGKGANQAVAAAHFGARVRFIGAVGDDADGRFLVEALKAKAVVTDDIAFVHSPSGNAVIFVNDRGENCITVYPGANLLVPCENTIRFEKGDYLAAQLEINMDAVQSFFLKARQRCATTILNPSPIRDIPEEVLGLTDILVANESEAFTLGGNEVDSVESAILCANAIRKLGPRHVIVTLGEQGSVYVNDDAALHFSCPSVMPVDTQGAGDMYLGALLAFISNGCSMEEAIRHASVAASLSVTKRGSTQSSLPACDEMIKFFS